MNKKWTLSFYAFSSIVILIMFLITAIVEHTMPMGFNVKVLISLSTVMFLVAGGIYLFNECRKKPVIVFILVGALLGLFILVNLHETKEKFIDLENVFCSNVCKYVGAEYKEGFALSKKIDDVNLVKSAMWQSLLKESIVNKNFHSFVKFYYYWWDSCEREKLKDNKHQFFDLIKPEKYNRGDVAYVNGHFRIFIRYIGTEELWVLDTPEEGVHKVISTPTHYEIYRWKEF